VVRESPAGDGPVSPLDRSPISTLKGAGPRTVERLAGLGIHTVQDLLFHLPLRYEDRTHVTPIGALRPGATALLEGRIELAQIRFGRKRSLIAALADGTGRVQLRFFYFGRTLEQRLKRGLHLACFGEARHGPNGLELVHPELHPLAEHQAAPTDDRLTPVYPATEGLSQATLRGLSAQALARLDNSRDEIELLPDQALQRLRLPALRDALRTVHRPPPGSRIEALREGRHSAVQRLALEELLAHHLGLRLLRQRMEHSTAPALAGDGRLSEAFLNALPFVLTAAQQRGAREVRADLECPRPMHRLVQGDVGSGKTVIAALAALHAIEAGHQVALMAPTELLAEQHARNLHGWFDPLGLRTAWLGGRLAQRARREVLAEIADGSAQLVVGTHALFQESVRFARLGLVIIDEQHRFGVHQRLALRAKGSDQGERAHQLVMTATPIPRTLAMAAYADLDTSVIDELPPGRTPIGTVALPESRRGEVVERVNAACRTGAQAYWVCTCIEESEALQCQAAAQTAEALADALPELRIGLAHGRMKGEQRSAVMSAFKAGELDLLVATTVVEVGVDVPNASLMIIDNAERLGLAQLHQLRGRVGRGTRNSVCVLLYQPPLSSAARARLAALRKSNDGFAIAQRDLELRGPGEVLGTRQTGVLELRIADLVRDAALVPEVERIATDLLARRPGAVAPLIHRWVGDRVNCVEA